MFVRVCVHVCHHDCGYCVPIGEEAFTSPGSDFYLAFVNNFELSSLLSNPILRLAIAPMDNETVQVAVEESDSVRYFNASDVIEVDFGVDMRLSEITDRDKGIHVTSVNGEEISIVALGSELQSADTFKVLPYVFLPNDGYEYYAISVPSTKVQPDFVPTEKSFFGIVAVEDDTVFTVELTQEVDMPLNTALELGLGSATLTAGTAVNITLQRSQTLYLSSLEDLTGSRVVSNKPISFVSGHECASVPSDVGYCDQLAEQIPPTATWGREFYTAPVADRQSYDTFKVLASRDDTTFVGDCLSQGDEPQPIEISLSAGEAVQFVVNSEYFCRFTSNRPTVLFQFSVGNLVDNATLADPFMVMIPPREQYQDKYFVSTFDLGAQASSSIGIVVPSAYDRDGVLLNGEPLVPANGWVDIPCMGDREGTCASISRVTVESGNHFLTHVNPDARYSVVVHWLSIRTGHGYVAGVSQKPIARKSPRVN